MRWTFQLLVLFNSMLHASRLIAESPEILLASWLGWNQCLVGIRRSAEHVPCQHQVGRDSPLTQHVWTPRTGSNQQLPRFPCVFISSATNTTCVVDSEYPSTPTTSKQFYLHDQALRVASIVFYLKTCYKHFSPPTLQCIPSDFYLAASVALPVCQEQIPAGCR